MKSTNIKKLVFSSLFLAIAYVLPFFTGQIQVIGNMLCPMHIPVILCGFICGAPWGMLVGLTAPLLRSLTLSIPPLFPRGICMAIELCSYGLFSGLFYKIFPKKKYFIYIDLLSAMIIGRIIWGISMTFCLTSVGRTYSFAAFFTSAVVNAIPGIIIQIVLIPIFVMLWEKYGKKN